MLRLIAYEFAMYLLTRPEKKAYLSEACKHVYQKYPPARDVLTRYGKLKGLASQCSYLELKGALHGGTYTLHLLEDKLKQAMQICICHNKIGRSQLVLPRDPNSMITREINSIRYVKGSCFHFLGS